MTRHVDKRRRPKNLSTDAIRELANELLKQISEKGDYKVPGYVANYVLHAALELLTYEGLIKRRLAYELTQKGKDHIMVHGCVLYTMPSKASQSPKDGK